MANGKSSSLKWGLGLLVVALAGGGGWYFTRDHDTVPEYQSATVTRGDLVETLWIMHLKRADS